MLAQTRRAQEHFVLDVDGAVVETSDHASPTQQVASVQAILTG